MVWLLRSVSVLGTQGLGFSVRATFRGGKGQYNVLRSSAVERVSDVGWMAESLAVTCWTGWR